jgi:hypothetical protein
MFIYKFDSKRQSLAINLYEVPEVKWLSNSNIRNLLQEDVTFFVDGFEKYYNIVADYYRKITAY